VAIILLLLLSLVTFLGVQSSMSEQRTATSDTRAKIVHRVAESGLDQAVEYVRVFGSTFLPAAGGTPDSTKWTLCDAADTTFPCGAADPSRRGLMYAYTGGADIPSNAASTAVDVKSLPMGQQFTTVGGFNVTYNVGALLCLIDSSTMGSGKAAQCTTSASSSKTNAVQLVSTGQIAGENARATISTMVGTYRIINTPPSLPPVVASSVISGLGNATIVANPDGGGGVGSHVPLSVWTRGYLGALGDTASGSYQTCESDEFFRTDNSATINSTTGAVLCDNCDCPAAAELSKNGTEGKDSLDRDDTDTGINKATDTVLSPTYSFPCDLFGYVFGVTGRTNAVDSDQFHDTPPLCETLAPSTIGGTSNEQDYIDANFTSNSNCDSLVGTTNSGGFFYLPNGCALSGPGQIGSPEHPVVLIADSTFKNSGPTIYGLVFVRDPATTYDPSVSGGAGAADYAPGGGTAVIYGALVIEGEGTLNGGLKIISSPATLNAILNDPNNVKIARVPGSWNDSLSY
jgi:hypothetical protein